jgi:uncharacterized protein YuzB (UPF0349 family)
MQSVKLKMLKNDYPVISYCLSNVDGETRKLLRQCEHEVIEDVCLQRCGHCFEGPFLLLGERLVTGVSHEEILVKILNQRMEKQE